MHALYTCAARLMVLPLALLAWGRGLRAPRQRTNLAQRFGLGSTAVRPGALWIHAVSVGEVQAAAPLVVALHARYPQRHIVVTTATPTGQERARIIMPAGVEVRFAPFDLPGAVRRFLARVQPSMVIILETELWPNLIALSAARGLPLVLASARISARSAARYRRYAPRLIANTLRSFALIAAQGETDAARFRELGAFPGRVQVTGNLKFDLELPAQLQEQGNVLRERYLRGTVPPRPVWVAGSTHPGEEAQLLQAHRLLLRDHPDALLIMAPRHPQRFDAAARDLEQSDMSWLRHSRGERGNRVAQVLLVDTLGELLAFYTLAQVAYVGGSLVPVGGHNLLEPAALGLPLLAGPHTFNSPQIAQLLIQSGGLQVVSDAAQLAQRLLSLIADPAERHRRGSASQTALAANRGALARLLQQIRALAEPAAAAAPVPAP